jgi:exopolysaccharide production protein ExoZ
MANAQDPGLDRPGDRIMTTAASDKTLVGVQMLRGAAALLVVFQHYVGTAAERGFAIPEFSGMWIGHAGVDIFFVISGFIMEYACGGKAFVPGDRKIFITRRLIRILPLYWTLTILVFAIAMLVPGAVHSKVGWDQFLMSMIVLPGLDGNGHQEYLITMAWTLTYEFYFYLVFSIFLSTSPRKRLLWMAAVFSVGAVAHLFFPRPHNTIAAVVSSPLAFEFLAGCVLAQLIRAEIAVSRLSSFLLIAIAATALLAGMKMEVDSTWMRLVQWGLPGALLVYGMVLGPGPKRSSPGLFVALFKHIGDISYSLYLSHFIGIAVFVRLYAMLAEKMAVAPWLAGIGLFAFCIMMAQICYLLIERPARIALQARLRRKG